MMKTRLEAIRKKIDLYAREAVEREIHKQVSILTEKVLKPIAEDFLSRTLEAYLTRHLTSSLEDVVGALEDVFDAPTDSPGVFYEEGEAPDIFGRDLSEVPVQEHEVVQRNKLLAFVQMYQDRENTDFAPKSKSISDATGLGSLEIMMRLSELREEGRIKGPTKSGRNSKITILKPLADPEQYL